MILFHGFFHLITSALSLAFSIRSCCSSVVILVSLLVVAIPQLGQQALFMASLMALFSSRSFSISAFNNEFSCRSCIAYSEYSSILIRTNQIFHKNEILQTKSYLDLCATILKPKLDLSRSKA